MAVSLAFVDRTRRWMRTVAFATRPPLAGLAVGLVAFALCIVPLAKLGMKNLAFSFVIPWILGIHAIGLVAPALFVRRAAVGQAMSAGAAVSLLACTFLLPQPHLGLASATLAVAWVGLFVDVRPSMRIFLLVYQYVAFVPFLEALGVGAAQTNLSLTIGLVHFLLVWATLPTVGRWRTGVLAAGAAAAAVAVGAAVISFAADPTNVLGRLELAFAALSVLVILTMLARLRSLQGLEVRALLPWGRWAPKTVQGVPASGAS